MYFCYLYMTIILAKVINFAFPFRLYFGFLYNIHASLLDKSRKNSGRQLHNQIDWNHRMICIKGFRGVGKTTFFWTTSGRNMEMTGLCSI
jgi:hypothetical protein